VLIRALEPLGDPSHLLANRRLDPAEIRMCTSGPGRVGEALGLDLDLNSAMLGPSSGIRVIDDGSRHPVHATPRVGISGGRELELRSILPGNPHVSRAPRHGRALTPTSRREQVDETR
jgi:DNA-3-methyladenine glycosylase